MSHWTVKGDHLGLDDYTLEKLAEYEDTEDTEDDAIFVAESAMEYWESGGSFAGDEIPDDDLIVVWPNGVTRTTVHMTVQHEVSFRGSIKEEEDHDPA